MHGAGFQGRADIAKILIDHGVRCVPFLRKWPNGAHIPSHFSCKRCASLIAGGVLRLRQGPRGSVDDKPAQKRLTFPFKLPKSGADAW